MESQSLVAKAAETVRKWMEVERVEGRLFEVMVMKGRIVMIACTIEKMKKKDQADNWKIPRVTYERRRKKPVTSCVYFLSPTSFLGNWKFGNCGCLPARIKALVLSPIVSICRNSKWKLCPLQLTGAPSISCIICPLHQAAALGTSRIFGVPCHHSFIPSFLPSQLRPLSHSGFSQDRLMGL